MAREDAADQQEIRPTPPPLPGDLLELVECMCPSLTPSSFPASLRRLFVVDVASREASALALWRSLLTGSTSRMRSLVFVPDPVGSVIRNSAGGLDGYRVHGLEASASGLDHLLHVAAGTRLAWGTRAAALAQLSTFVASGPSRALAFMRTASCNLASLIVDIVRSSPWFETECSVQPASGAEANRETTESRNPHLEFLIRICNTICVLLLAGGSRSWAAQRLFEHRSSLLDNLWPLAFHRHARLRVSALQAMACLLFNPDWAFNSDVQREEATSAITEALALPLPEQLAAHHVLPVHVVLLVRPPSPGANFWGASLCARTVAICQVVHHLQVRMGLDIVSKCKPDEPGGEAGSLTATSSRSQSSTPQSAVWHCSAASLASAVSVDELFDAVEHVVLIKPMGMWLLHLPNYMQRLLPAAALSAQKGSGRIDRCLILVEHLCEALEALGGNVDQCFREGDVLQQVAEVFVAHIMPFAQSIVGCGRIESLPHCSFGAPMTSDARSDVSAATARGRLAADVTARRFVAGTLRLAIMLARLGDERCRRTLLSREWCHYFASLLASSIRPLRRLALAAALVIVPKLSVDRTLSVGDDLLHALLGCLATSAASFTSLQHSFELKASLSLLTKSVLRDTTAVLEDVATCVAHWLAHTDDVVRALAWRALCRVAAVPVLDSQMVETMVRTGHVPDGAVMTAATARALRTLRLWKAVGKSTQDVCPEKELVLAEMMEYLRTLLMPVVSTSELKSRASRILEAGLLTGDVVPACLASGHLGLRCSVTRLLHALLMVEDSDETHARSAAVPEAATEAQAADAAETRVVPGVRAQLRVGLWPQALAAVCTSMGEDGVANQIDVAIVFGNFAAFVGDVVATEPQLLVWLASSSKFLERWRIALEGFCRSLIADAKGNAGIEQNVSVALADIAATHLRALFAVASAVRLDILGPVTDMSIGQATAEMQVAPRCWAPVANFLHSPAVAALLTEGLHERMPAATRLAATSATTALSGLRLLGLDVVPAVSTDDGEALGRACAKLFEDWVVQPGGAPSLEVVLPPVAAVHRCLVNLFHASSAAATAAWNSALPEALANHIATLAAPQVLCTESGASQQQRQQPLSSSQAQPQRRRLTWGLRVLAALLSASGQILEESTRPGPHRTSQSAPAPLMLQVLRSVRAVAEKDDGVCYEVLDLICRCLQADRIRVTAGEGDGLASALLHWEFVPWMMRLSLRRKLPGAAYCRVMEALTFCAPVLSGKPLLLRYLQQVLEGIRSLSRPVNGALVSAQQVQKPTEEWRYRRLLAALRFVAALRLCPRCVALLVSSVPPAHGGGGGKLTSLGEFFLPGGGLGLDFWLDLLEPAHTETRERPRLLPVPVRAAVLRVLLAVLVGATSSARTCFLASPRALASLLSQLRPGGPPLLALPALNAIWLLVHRHQAAAPELRRLRAAEAALAAVSAWPHGADAEELAHAKLMAQQVSLALRRAEDCRSSGAVPQGAAGSYSSPTSAAVRVGSKTRRV
eukprot:gnl/TRDRNA2_/TRDRNA2_133529_c0_seq1.p1 gnl/TRDRNA2_/TRDRNA2_133529_c0~~gnl/TRDRNA2_/TRDRNA2_133529_c0_seq1.p1  ORF type:complete len:1652 (-),score=254.08 gnl/TRDRNA2_/TRDRNA2_133529_c0_seq1:51-4568(-)